MKLTIILSNRQDSVAVRLLRIWISETESFDRTKVFVSVMAFILLIGALKSFFNIPLFLIIEHSVDLILRCAFEERNDLWMIKW
jgi:hypothetical protein